MRICRGVDPGQRSCARAAGSRTGQRVRRSGRGIHDRPQLMVVPSIGVVIHNDHCRAAPGRQRLQQIDRVHHEGLFVQRIGVSRMRVLIGRRLQKAHGRKISARGSRVEILDVILVVGRTSPTDFRQRSRPGVVGIGHARPISEQRVMRNVIRCRARQSAGTARAARRPVGIHDRQVEAAHEAAPAHARRVEQVADRLAAHLDLVARRVRANVPNRIGIANHGQRTVRSAAHFVPGSVQRGDCAVGLACDRVQHAHRRRTEGGAVRVIAQREILRVVPHGRRGVPVKVAHDQPGGLRHSRTARRRSGRSRVFRIQILRTTIGCLLLGLVVVVHVVGHSLRTIQTEGIGRARSVSRIQVGVVGQQRRAQTVHCRRVRRWNKPGLARGIRCVRVSSKIVVERNVLVENHHQMLNWRRRCRRRILGWLARRLIGGKRGYDSRSQSRGQCQ